MKKLLAMFAICMAFSAPVAAEPILKSKPVQCAPPIDVMNHYVLDADLKVMFLAVVNVRTQYNEIVPAAISFWANPETGKFIMVEGDKHEVCVISVGDRLDFNINHDEIIQMYLQAY